MHTFDLKITMWQCSEWDLFIFFQKWIKALSWDRSFPNNSFSIFRLLWLARSPAVETIPRNRPQSVGTPSPALVWARVSVEGWAVFWMKTFPLYSINCSMFKEPLWRVGCWQLGAGRSMSLLFVGVCLLGRDLQSCALRLYRAERGWVQW